MLGWGLAQAPYLIYPAVTHMNAAAPAAIMGPALGVLAAGAALVLPAFAWLYYVFKFRAQPPAA